GWGVGCEEGAVLGDGPGRVVLAVPQHPAAEEVRVGETGVGRDGPVERLQRSVGEIGGAGLEEEPAAVRERLDVVGLGLQNLVVELERVEVVALAEEL